MDNELKISGMDKQKSKETITREKFEDGSSLETRIEEVKGGWIITKEKNYKDSKGEWQYETEKSVTTEDPNLDKTSAGIANRLESIFKNLE
jgi:hypothetical protein